MFELPGDHNWHSVVQLFVVVIVLAVDEGREKLFDASVAVADDAADNAVAAEKGTLRLHLLVDNRVAAAVAVAAIEPL